MTTEQWLVQHYDSSWGGWRVMQDTPRMTEAEAKALARRLGTGTTFRYRAVPVPRPTPRPAREARS